MEETEALINRILEDHKVIKQGVRNLEEVANDIGAMAGLDDIKGDFVPGRFDQKQSLERLQDTLEKITRGLEAHFASEETGLLAAFEKHGDSEIAAGLRSLFLEHEDLRGRLTHAREHVTQLISGGLASHLWEASAHDMRAHLSHTRKLIEAHAEAEQELFHTLKKNRGKPEGKGR